MLQRYYPALLELKRDPHDAFLLELLKAYPDPEAGRRARHPRLRRMLREHRIRVLSADELSERLRRKSFWVSGPVMAACRDEALDLVAQIELLNEQIEASERRLRELFKKHPDRELLESLPGLGEILTIRVAAELGEHRAHDGDASSAQAYSGTAPVTRRSGKGRVNVRMRRGCNRELQSAMYQMARCSVCKSEWAASYLQHLKERGVPNAKAVRSLSNKWMKIVVAMLSTQFPYDEALHVQHLRRYQVPWAPQLPVPGDLAA
jgi:transposase